MGVKNENEFSIPDKGVYQFRNLSISDLLYTLLTWNSKHSFFSSLSVCGWVFKRIPALSKIIGKKDKITT